jgi:hypothetical protein
MEFLFLIMLAIMFIMANKLGEQHRELKHYRKILKSTPPEPNKFALGSIILSGYQAWIFFWVKVKIYKNVFKSIKQDIKQAQYGHLVED